jgi:hypothetical protein
MSLFRPIQKGATDESVTIRIVDDTTGLAETGVTSATAGLALFYHRDSSASATITASPLDDINSAHSDGGIKHIASGYYRLDVPDAAFASQTTIDGVLVGGSVTSMVIYGTYVPLTSDDPTNIASLVTVHPGSVVSANLQLINDVTLTGDGSTSSWGPA